MSIGRRFKRLILAKQHLKVLEGFSQNSNLRFSFYFCFLSLCNVLTGVRRYREIVKQHMPRFFKLFLLITSVLLLLGRGHSEASCISFCDSYHVDTLSEGVVEVKCLRDSVVQFTYQIHRQDMLDSMLSIFYSVNYCWIGKIDSIHQFYLPPDKNRNRYSADSIRVVIDSALKGYFGEKNFWAIDKESDLIFIIDSTGGISVTSSEPGPGNYHAIIGYTLIFFADSLENIRKCGIQPPGMCIEGIRGYTVDKNKKIYNSNDFPYVDVPLDQFFGAIKTGAIIQTKKQSTDHSVFYHVYSVPARNEIIISLSRRIIPEIVGLYDINGRLIRFYHFSSGDNLICETKGLSAGNYILKTEKGGIVLGNIILIK